MRRFTENKLHPTNDFARSLWLRSKIIETLFIHVHLHFTCYLLEYISLQISPILEKGFLKDFFGIFVRQELKLCVLNFI